VSADLRDHVVGWNLLPLLLSRDPAFAELFCYSDVLSPDGMTDKLRACFDVWRHTAGLSHARLAELVQRDAIDILVDLSLHTAGNRLLAFARKPAPIQVTYLGYCGTTGMDSIDYRISDPHMDPADADLTCYAETTVRLPQSYWCYRPGGPTPEVAALPADARGRITFGCLNNFAKVSPGALDAWAGILLRVPRSRLLLHVPPGDYREKTLARLIHRGVAREALEFLPRQPWDQYVQVYNSMDIALDPFPFGGGITSCDALWMGVPLVSLAGKTAVGRGGASILNNIALPELLAQDVDQYVRIAAELANDLPRLRHLRTRLRTRMQDSPLMDAPAMAKDLEQAYRRMWVRWCESQPPAPATTP
jgi:predicted O-linked N-acetylglucosamine transferase (SPINDLY family)